MIEVDAMAMDRCLTLLDEANLMQGDSGEENRQLLLHHHRSLDLLAQELDILSKTKPPLLNQMILTHLLQKTDALKQILTATKILNSAKLLTRESMDQIFWHAEVADSLAEGFAILNQPKPRMQIMQSVVSALGIKNLIETNHFTKEHRALLFKNPYYAKHLALAIRILNQHDLLNEDVIQALNRNASEALSIASVLQVIDDNHPGLLTPRVVKELLEHAEDGAAIAEVLKITLPKKIVTPQNLLTLIQNGKYANDLIIPMKYFTEENILTVSNYTDLIDKAEFFAPIFENLYNTYEGLLTPDNCAIILESAESSEAYAYLFKILVENDPGLLIQENFDAVVANQLYIFNIANAARQLSEVSRLNQETFNQLIDNPHDAENIAMHIIDPARGLNQERRRQAFFFHTNAASNSQRLEKAGFPDEFIPEKYLCALLNVVMDNPVSLPNKGKRAELVICDRSSLLGSLDQKPVNPFTREAMQMGDAREETGLRDEIKKYVEGIEKAVMNKKRETGRDELSMDEYREIAVIVTGEGERKSEGEHPPGKRN
jgi:hypothetical protein